MLYEHSCETTVRNMPVFIRQSAQYSMFNYCNLVRKICRKTFGFVALADASGSVDELKAASGPGGPFKNMRLETFSIVEQFT